jgi:hypothetical protein
MSRKKFNLDENIFLVLFPIISYIVTMKTNQAFKLVGGLSRPSKMPGFAYGLPAKECKTGSKLAQQENTVCSDCYALKGCYVFEVVQAAQYRRLESIKNPGWVSAMVHLINSKKSKFFRWHDSGDVQDLEHLNKIFEVCELTPGISHWMPTREAWTKEHVARAPKNLVIRFSMPMIDQNAGGSWPNTSTVVTEGATCPAPKQGNACGDCRACWDPKVKNIAYGKH